MKKKLILKSLSSSEVDLKNWYPETNEEVFVCLDLEVGYSGDADSSNLFYVTLATPESLLKHRDGQLLVKNRTIVIAHYDYKVILDGVLDILQESSRATWEESCTMLQRYFQWEYEDYIAGD